MGFLNERPCLFIQASSVTALDMSDGMIEKVDRYRFPLKGGSRVRHSIESIRLEALDKDHYFNDKSGKSAAENLKPYRGT
jgi:hypothetical protein